MPVNRIRRGQIGQPLGGGVAFRAHEMVIPGGAMVIVMEAGGPGRGGVVLFRAVMVLWGPGATATVLLTPLMGYGGAGGACSTICIPLTGMGTGAK